jgi:hypothetical protein
MKKIEETNLNEIQPWTVLQGDTEDIFVIVLPEDKTVSIDRETSKWLRAQLNSIR